MHTIHELAAQGISLHHIARQLGLARNTVRKYVRGAAIPAARAPKPLKLDPFKDQIRHWVQEDHLLNCVPMLERLRPLGYTGGVSQLKAFVQPLRPPRAGHHPVRRYETAPGAQMQFDWGALRYDQDGSYHKVFGFTAVLSYSRMRFKELLFLSSPVLSLYERQNRRQNESQFRSAEGFCREQNATLLYILHVPNAQSLQLTCRICATQI